MQHPNLMPSLHPPGTSNVEKSPNTGNAYYCNRHGAVIENPVWILVGDIYSNDYRVACPVCFRDECPQIGKVALASSCHANNACKGIATEICSRCQLSFCKWHVGATSKKALLCKVCSDVVPKSEEFRCVTCQSVTGMKCKACGQYTCPTHFDPNSNDFCIYCSN